MNYLITGATGNIGSLVVNRLLDRGERPRVLARDAQKALSRYGDRVDIFVGDFSDATSMAAALSGVDAFLLVSSVDDLAARDEVAAKAAKAARSRADSTISAQRNEFSSAAAVCRAMVLSSFRSAVE